MYSLNIPFVVIIIWGYFGLILVSYQTFTIPYEDTKNSSSSRNPIQKPKNTTADKQTTSFHI